MESNKVNMYLMQYKSSVPNEKILILKNALNKANEEKEENLSAVKLYNPIAILIFSIFLGSFGVDRFMLGDVGLGICKLLFGWLTLGIWPLIDIFTCYNKAKEKNLQNLLLALS